MAFQSLGVSIDCPKLHTLRIVIDALSGIHKVTQPILGNIFNNKSLYLLPIQAVSIVL